MDLEILKKAGLNEYESKVFLCLSKEEKIKPSSIAKESGVPRSRVYDVLKSLMNKGLVIENEDNVKSFRLNNLEECRKILINEHEERIKELRLSINQMLENAKINKLEEKQESNIKNVKEYYVGIKPSPAVIEEINPKIPKIFLKDGFPYRINIIDGRELEIINGDKIISTNYKPLIKTMELLIRKLCENGKGQA